jgi:hypothetical protein
MTAKISLVCALSLVLFAASGCASQAQSTPAPAPAPAAATPSTPAPVEVRTNLEFGGPQVSIYHPDTRTLYLWSGDPRPGPPHRDQNCIKIQLSDSLSGGPVTNEPCPK